MNRKKRIVVWLIILFLAAVNPFFISGSVSAGAICNVTIDYKNIVRVLNPDFHGVNFVAFWDPYEGSEGSREALRRAGIDFIRFPGGEPGNWYDWAKPSSWTNTRPADMWEYAKAAGAKVLFQTNPTSNQVDDDWTNKFNDPSGEHVANWVQWAKDNNVDAAVWEVGNEPDMHEVYTANNYEALQWYFDIFNEQAQAMKAENPDIIIAGGALTNAYFWWALNTLEMFINQCGQNADAVSIHWYGDNEPDYYKTRDMAQRWQENWDFIRSKTDKPVYITEWNSMGANTGEYPQTTGLAISNCDVIGAYAKSGVEAHAYFGCLHYVYNNWGMFYSPIENKPLDSVTPTYFIFPLWDKMGDKVLNAVHDADASDEMNVWAHKKDDGSVQVMVINKSEAKAVKISFKGYNPEQKAVSIHRLVAADAKADEQDVYYNEVFNPSPAQEDLPKAQVLISESSLFSYNAPAYSITVLDFHDEESKPAETEPVTEGRSTEAIESQSSETAANNNPVESTENKTMENESECDNTYESESDNAYELETENVVEIGAENTDESENKNTGESKPGNVDESETYNTDESEPDNTDESESDPIVPSNSGSRLIYPVIALTLVALLFIILKKLIKQKAGN